MDYFRLLMYYMELYIYQVKKLSGSIDGLMETNRKPERRMIILKGAAISKTLKDFTGGE